LAKTELAKVQDRNQRYYNRRTRNRSLKIGDSVLLLLPTEHNRLTLAWYYDVVGKVGDVDYKIKLPNDKVITFHVNMLKKYFHRNESDNVGSVNRDVVENEQCVTVDNETVANVVAASVACVIDENSTTA